MGETVLPPERGLQGPDPKVLRVRHCPLMVALP